jgi:tight adherence protein C
VDAIPASTILAVLVAFCMIGGGVALLVGAYHQPRADIARRVDLIASHAGFAREAAADHARAVASTLELTRAPSTGMSVVRQRQIETLRRRLRIPMRYEDFVFPALRAVSVTVCATSGWLLTAAFFSGAPFIVALLGPAVFAAVGWIAPAALMARAEKRHVRQAAEGLPDALELLVVCVESGMSLDDAIDRITGDLRWSRPALAEELMLTSADLKILPERDQALANLAARIDVPSVKSVVTSLSQTLRYGTPLAQALKSTASELRNDALVRMEEKAAGLPALLTLPMMLFIMPTIFMILLGPAVLRILDMVSGK